MCIFTRIGLMRILQVVPSHLFCVAIPGFSSCPSSISEIISTWFLLSSRCLFTGFRAIIFSRLFHPLFSDFSSSIVVIFSSSFQNILPALFNYFNPHNTLEVWTMSSFQPAATLSTRSTLLFLQFHSHTLEIWHTIWEWRCIHAVQAVTTHNLQLNIDRFASNLQC